MNKNLKRLLVFVVYFIICKILEASIGFEGIALILLCSISTDLSFKKDRDE